MASPETIQNVGAQYNIQFKIFHLTLLERELKIISNELSLAPLFYLKITKIKAVVYSPVKIHFAEKKLLTVLAHMKVLIYVITN